MILLVLVFVLPQVLYFLLGPVIAVGHAAFRAVL
jgi:hypothetical protein